MAYTPPRHDQINFEIATTYTPPGHDQINFEVQGEDVVTIKVFAPPLTLIPELSVRIDTEIYCPSFTLSPELSVVVGVGIEAPAFELLPLLSVSASLGPDCPPFGLFPVLDVGEVYFFDPSAVYCVPFELSPELSVVVGTGINAPLFTATPELSGLTTFPIVVYAEPFTAQAVLSAEPWSNTAWIEFARLMGSDAVKLYFCHITGDGNGLSDIVVPITSFQSRRRSGSPSYLQVAIPGLDLYEEVVNRIDGDIVVKMGYQIKGEIQYIEEIARVNIGNIDYSKGGKSQSITLSGHKQTTYTNPKGIGLTNVVSRSFVSGRNRVRCAVPDLYLLPGDSAIIEGVSFTADLITTTVSISNGGAVSCSMDVAED